MQNYIPEKPKKPLIHILSSYYCYHSPVRVCHYNISILESKYTTDVLVPQHSHIEILYTYMHTYITVLLPRASLICSRTYI